MSTSPHPSRSRARTQSRRSMLQYSAAGGMAVAAHLIGLPGWAEAAQAGAKQPAPARMRRVVTGQNRDGTSRIVSDESVAVTSLWTTSPDRPMGAGPDGESLPARRATGQTRCFVASIGPSADPKPNLTNRIGFHRTPGIAYCYILTGEIVFLVDQAEVRLVAGDLVVERNTDHSWRNETTAPVTMLITVVNADA